MIEKVEYIKSIFKLDIDNSYLITDIAEKLVKVKDFDNYRKWLHPNLNHEDTQYMKPFEKFVFLTRKYLIHELELKNKDRIVKGNIFAKNLANKVKQVAPSVENNGLKVKKVSLNGKNFFTNFELSQLDKLGGLSLCLRAQKSVSGSDELEEKLVALMYDIVVTNIIEYKPKHDTEKNVSILLDGSVKKI